MHLISWVGLLLLIILFSVDLYLDIHQRDSFSWMDPGQYYQFAKDVMEGRKGISQFEIPSIFPLFIIPSLRVHNSIAGALGINLLFLVLLVIGIHLLCRELEVKTPSPIIALLVLTSPLIIGLSRSLYLEFAMTALVTLAFFLWLRMLKESRWTILLWFSIIFILGFMTKMTFPLFFVMPFLGAAIGNMANGKYKKAILLVPILLTPIFMVVLIQKAFFPVAFNYYLSLGHTTLPIMYLIGPPQILSGSSMIYYFLQLGKTMLFLLVPFLAIAVVTPWRWWRTLRWSTLAGHRAALWLWMLGPMVLLILQPVKEPRHAAPCVIPAVLLIFIGLENILSRRLRITLIILAAIIGIIQYITITRGFLHVPYFMDRPTHIKEIRNQVLAADPNKKIYRFTPRNLRWLHWFFNQNIAIGGFDPNTALTITWAFQPGIVFDLDTMDDPNQLSDRIPYRRFEDLLIFSSFNTYNRRCGWHWYFLPLSRQQVIDNADFLLLKNIEQSKAEQQFPHFQVVTTIRTGNGPILLLRSDHTGRKPFREMYAREFLKRHPSLSPVEQNTIGFDLRLTAALGGNMTASLDISRQFPGLNQLPLQKRYIYFIGNHGNILYKEVATVISRNFQLRH